MKSSITPELTLQSVWDENISTQTENSSGTCKNLSEHLQYFNCVDQQGILNELLLVEAESMRRDNRLRYIRKKIMALIDRKYSAQHLDHLLDESDVGSREHDKTKASLRRALADCEIQIYVLRAYIQGKYGDANKNDWYDQYEYLSDKYQAALMHKTNGNGQKPIYFNGAPMAASKENFQLCRKKCLDAFVSQEFTLQPNRTGWLSGLISAFKSKPIWRKLVS